MKYTERHGRIWSRVDRIQTAPDMRKTVFNPPVQSREDYELKNSFRL